MSSPAYDQLRLGASRFYLLIAGMILLGACLTVILVEQQRQRQFVLLEAKAEERLDLYASTLQAAVGRFDYLPFLLASDHDAINLARGQDASQPERTIAMNNKLKQWQTESGAAVIYLMSAEGVVLATSNFDLPSSFFGQNYRFRPYFTDAKAGRRGQFFAIGYTTGLPGYFLSYPVVISEEVAGVAVVKIDLTQLERDWNAGGEVLMVTDLDSVVYLSSRPEWKYHSLAPLSASTAARLQAQRKYTGQALGVLAIGDMGQSPDGSPLQKIDGVPYLSRHRRVDMINGELHYFGEIQPLLAKQREGWLMGGLGTLLIAVISQLWLLRRQSRRQQKLVRHRLAQSAAEQRRIIENTQAGLVTTDDRLRIEFANPTALALLDLRADDVQGHGLLQWLRKPDGTTLVESDISPAVDLELLAMRPNGYAVPVQLSCRPLSRSRQDYLLTLQDISELKKAGAALRDAHDELERRVVRRTRALYDSNERLREEVVERQRAEEQLKQAQQELIQAAKLAALGQMSAGIVHEINQPLAAMQTFLASARLLLQRGQTEMAGASMEDIGAMLKRVNTIISHLKSFASKSEGKTRAVDLCKAIDNALILLGPRIDRDGVKLVWSTSPPALWVLGGDIRLEQILINLIRNALDAVQGVSDPEVVIELRRAAPMSEVRVIDNGHGIPQQVIERLFDPFFSTKGVGEGMGLGLSVSYGIARSFGGDLRATNRVPCGACFTLALLSAGSEDGGQGEQRG